MAIFNHPQAIRAAALLPRPTLGAVFRLAVAAYAVASVAVLVKIS